MEQSRVEGLQRNHRTSNSVEIIFNALKTELAVRTNNTHIGSGQGGDVSLLYALLSREVKSSISYTITAPKIVEITDSVLSIAFPGSWFDVIEENTEREHCEFQHIFRGKKLVRVECLAYVRATLNEHRKDLVKELVAEDTVLSPLWLREQPQTPEVLLLASCLSACYQILPDLRRKNIALDKVDEAFFCEEEVVQQEFLTEMKLPKDAFTFVEGSSLQRRMLMMIEKHPVYGEKLKKISERKVKIISLLLEGQAAEALLTINSFPEYIKILCVRNLIGLDMMVGMELDNFITVREQA